MVQTSLRPCLLVFKDAWSSLAQFKDLIDKMAEADGQNISGDEFQNILLDIDIKDITSYYPHEE